MKILVISVLLSLALLFASCDEEVKTPSVEPEISQSEASGGKEVITPDEQPEETEVVEQIEDKEQSEAVEDNEEATDNVDQIEEPEQPAECIPTGDADGDGKITVFDATAILEYIASWDIVVDEAQLNAVNDGQVNLNDVTAVLQHIAGWTTVRLGHNDTATVLSKSTCQVQGETKLSCAACGSEETVEIPKTHCIYDKVISIPPTCGSDGLERDTCIMCNKVVEVTLRATGNHTYEMKSKTSPTCVADGIEIYECKVCCESYSIKLSATGNHTYQMKSRTNPTCVADGVEIYECSVCRHSYNVKLSATGSHSFALSNSVAPTCSANGVDTYYCTVCNKTENRTVPATGYHHTVHGICVDCGRNDGSYDTRVYTIGQTWVVAGQWELTINSVTTHKLCNSTENAYEGYTDEQVITINYTYKNIGYRTDGLNLYLNNADFIVHDETGAQAKLYPCQKKKKAQQITVGQSCTAEEAFVLRTHSNGIIFEVNQYVADGSRKEHATFVLKIS